MIEIKKIMRCDICGVDVKCFEHRYILKRKAIWWDFFTGDNRNITKLDVCEDCINRICNAYKEKKGE